MGTAMTLERYAEIRAEMDSGRLGDDVLAGSSVTQEEWTAAQREWLEKMGSELERGRLELTNRYAQAFVERQRALKASAAPPPPIAVVPPPLYRATSALPLDQQTLPLGENDALRRAAVDPLPFQPSPSPAPAPAPLPIELQQTVPIPVARAPEQPRLSLEQYALLCIELWREPFRMADVRARYGLTDDAAWSAVNSYWRDRMDREPAVQERWRKLMSRK